MARQAADGVKRVALVGAGVIGAGWAANFLARGYDVVVTDPGAGAEAKLRESVANAWPALQRVGLASGADQARLSFTANLEEAVSQADFIQESAPENEELKTRLLAQVDAAAAPDVIIASSSSGLLPSRIQAACKQPGRVLIGHPFNPVYLLPLVEVLGGEQTDAESVDWAMEFYAQLGKKPLKVRKEVPGYISDRLQEAIWREALHMVADGTANTAEIDAAICDGPGLRWALMGPCLTFHLAGGETGMAHMLAQFGPALKLPWTRLEAPELTEELSNRMIEGTQAQAGNRSIRELERMRDQALIGFMRVVGQLGTERYSEQAQRRFEADEAVEAPLALLEIPVRPEWIDYNGHMSESCYLTAFGDASDALFRYVGIDEAYRAGGLSFYTVETHLNNLREASDGDRLRMTTQILGLDEKRLHLFHAMYDAGAEELIATAEQMLLHVDSAAQRAAPIAPEVQAKLKAIAAAHGSLEQPSQVGRVIGIKR